MFALLFNCTLCPTIQLYTLPTPLNLTVTTIHVDAKHNKISFLFTIKHAMEVGAESSGQLLVYFTQSEGNR